METRLNPVPFGLHAIECIVESICHLAPHLNGKDIELSSHSVSSFLRAIEFLERTSSAMGAARRALAVLGEIIDRVKQTVFDSEQCFAKNKSLFSTQIHSTSAELSSKDVDYSDRSGLNLQGLSWEPFSGVSGEFPHLDWGLPLDPSVDDFLRDLSDETGPFTVLTQ